jgi:hypothetical protein
VKPPSGGFLFGGINRKRLSALASLPGASFVVNGAAQAHDSTLTTASIEMKWINGWSAAATFEGEFAQLRRQGRRAVYLVSGDFRVWHF